MAPDKWDKELAKIDRQLESISDEALLPTKDAPTKGASTPAAKSIARETQHKTSTLGVMLRLVLAVALGVGILFWPYDARCGIGLAGYLGAVTAIQAAEAGLPVRYQLLIYPVTDMTGRCESRRTFAHGFYLTREFISLAELSYLHAAQDRRDPRVSPLFTEKVPDGLAPAFVATAGFDPLRDEGEAYARLLADHGVPVELKRYPGHIHGFANIVGAGRSNPAAVAEMAAKLKAAMH
jgi:hypothetical protein